MKKEEELIDYYFQIRVTANPNFLQPVFYLWLSQDGWVMDEYGQAFRYCDIDLDGKELRIYMTDGIIYQQHEDKYTEHSEDPDMIRTFTVRAAGQQLRKFRAWIENQRSLIMLRTNNLLNC